MPQTKLTGTAKVRYDLQRSLTKFSDVLHQCYEPADGLSIIFEEEEGVNLRAAKGEIVEKLDQLNRNLFRMRIYLDQCRVASDHLRHVD